MSATPESILLKQLKNLAHIDGTLKKIENISEIPINKDFTCIVLELEGKISGFFAMSSNTETEAYISLKIISKALETNFPSAELTDELITNTIGELGNMILGDYFLTLNNKKGTHISAPIYSNTLDQKNTISKAVNHFKVDTDEYHFYLSYSLVEMQDK